MSELHPGQPRHRRLRMTVLVLATIISVSIWLAVLFWNGCVGGAPHMGSLDRAPHQPPRVGQSNAPA
jgi:hypothetical protein